MSEFAWFDIGFLHEVFEGGGRPKPRPAPRAPTREWEWAGERVKARTKSEARSLFKRLTGGRLPPGTVVREVR
jgi:hypothetical protein